MKASMSPALSQPQRRAAARQPSRRRPRKQVLPSTPGRRSPFQQLTSRYDAWFESPHGRRIFRVEKQCIRGLLNGLPRPWVEIGVGTGRFAAALKIEEGLDPSSAALRYAARRGIRIRQGRAEQLPYSQNRFGAALLLVTICFLDDPTQALLECWRVLKKEGGLIIGLVPKNSAWGRAYARRGAAGHPFYAAAQFYTAHQIIALAEQAGFCFERASSCLLMGPDLKEFKPHRPRAGLLKQAGFVGLRFRKKEERAQTQSGINKRKEPCQ